MRKGTIFWLVLAAVLIIVGLILFAAAMQGSRWDFAKLSTQSFETNTHEITEEFNNITINTSTADIVFVLSDNEKCQVECFEEEKAKHTVSVRGDTLVIQVTERKAWYDYIGIHLHTPRITLSLPREDFAALCVKGSTGRVTLPKGFRFEAADISLSTGSVEYCAATSGTTKIHTTTGSIHVENTSAGALELSASTGKITVTDAACTGDARIRVTTGKTALTNVTCRNLTADGSTGDILLAHVMVTEKLCIDRSTGDVRFEGADAGELFVKTDTGKVTGSLLTGKMFVTDTDTGKISVPESVAGGKCEIRTDTGNIQISVKGE